MLTLQEYSKTIIFPIGNTNDAYAKYFIGQSYIAPISTEQVKIYNVTFEPKCRNNWHIHRAKSGGGQMLIAVGGRGYYQEWGKEPIEMKPGDVINIPANVKHWHGAAPDSWFSHLAVEVDGVETSNEWLEPVTDEEYSKLKQGKNGNNNTRIQRTNAKKGAYAKADGLPEKLTGNEPQFVKDYWDYYKTKRGFHSRSINSNGNWNMTSSLSLINQPILQYSSEIRTPVLVVHGENAHSRYFGEDAFKKLKGDNKELLIVKGANRGLV